MKKVNLYLLLIALFVVQCSSDDSVTNISEKSIELSQSTENANASNDWIGLDIEAYSIEPPFGLSDINTICSNSGLEYRMTWGGSGEPNYTNWYVSESTVTSSTPVRHQGQSMLLFGNHGETNSDGEFYLVAEAYDDPNEPFETRAKRGYVVTSEFCDTGDPTCGPDEYYSGHGCLPCSYNPSACSGDGGTLPGIGG